MSLFGLIQNNLNGSNTDCSFTVDDSNSFFSPYKILPIAQENKYLVIFFLILSWNCRIVEFWRFYWVHSTYNLFVENRKDFHKLSLFASWTGAMINPQWLELPMSRTNFYSPKDVQAIEVRLYIFNYFDFASFSRNKICHSANLENWLTRFYNPFNPFGSCRGGQLT